VNVLKPVILRLVPSIKQRGGIMFLLLFSRPATIKHPVGISPYI